MSIRLNKKYGLNPTMPICLYCGKSKNEIILLGASYKEEAPHSMVVDYRPCEECEKKMKSYVALLEANEDKKPTGNIVWIKRTAWKKMFNIPKPKTIGFIDNEAYRKLSEKNIGGEQ